MSLVAAYLDALPHAARREGDQAAIAGELSALCVAVRDAVPGLEPVLPEFVRSLAAHQSGEKLPPPDRAVDLAIAFGAARGEAGAVRTLDALLVGSVARAVARMDRSPAFADSVAQELRMRLLVGERPRIIEYSGNGPLAGWLRIAAARIALNLRRSAADRGHDDISSNIRDAVSAPEVAILRARYRDDFEAALREALEALPSRERALLCLSVRDGLSGEKIAALYRVSRATAKRMVVRARTQLLVATKQALYARLGLTTSEFESVAHAVCDDIDVSVVRLLQAEG